MTPGVRHDTMQWLTQHGRGITRVLAVLLIAAGGSCGYWWLYKLAPSRRALAPDWVASHSQLEYWLEVQKGIRRGMWFHDDGFTVGMYGDKSWAEWIIARVKPGTSMGCAGSPCHSASSMRLITNQDVGEDADAWLDWWRRNKTKSQGEWMRDGFRQCGIEVDVPPTPEQSPALLVLLGDAETNALKAISKEVRYNAFRCLRDSGFDPVAFAISNRIEGAEIERGLLEYARRQRLLPLAGGVGILPFGRRRDEPKCVTLPVLATPRFRLAANALVFGLPLVGAGLLFWSGRRRKDGEPAWPGRGPRAPGG